MRISDWSSDVCSSDLEFPCVGFELVCPGLALPEGLQSGEALDRIEEFGCEGSIGLLPAERVGDVDTVPERRGEQGEKRETEHRRRHRQVEEGKDSEEQGRRPQTAQVGRASYRKKECQTV